MIKIYSLLFGIIASLSIFLYVFMYVLRNIYYYVRNNALRRFINKLLPFFSTYNSLFLILALICSLLHIIGIFIDSSIFNTGYVIFFILLITIKFNFFDTSKSNDDSRLNLFSYLLLFALIIHCFV